MITAEKLRAIMQYDAGTGVFQYRIGQRVGGIAGSFSHRGYRKVCIDGRNYYEHRLAWLYMTGEWPHAQIDHKDMNTLNNRWQNLRYAIASQNHGNSHRRVNNTSGFKGVSWSRRNSAWIAQITRHGVHACLGIFTSREEAFAAYCVAARDHFGEFFRVTSGKSQRAQCGPGPHP